MNIMKKRILLLSLFVLLLDVAVLAQSRVGTSAAPFLTMGVGAKGMALGHANSVYVSGAEAIFWNPSGISLKNDAGLSSSGFFSVNQYFLDVDIYATALVIPVGGEESGQNFVVGMFLLKLK